MKKIIALALFGIGLFGLSAGVGMALRPKPAAHDETAEHGSEDQETGDGTETAATGSGDAGHGTSSESGSGHSGGAGHADAGAGHGDVASSEHGADASHGDDPDAGIPTAIRPDSMSVEEIVRYGLGLKERDEAVRVREETLERREEQQKMMLTDILTEQKELEGLHAQARDQRLAVEKLLKDLAAQKNQLDAERKTVEEEKKSLDVEKARIEGATSAGSRSGAASISAADRSANAKEAAAAIGNMQPREAARTLEAMYNSAEDGPMDAVEILTQIPEKSRAGILEGISDEKVRVDMINLIMKKQRPTRVGRR